MVSSGLEVVLETLQWLDAAVGGVDKAFYLLLQVQGRRAEGR